MTDSPLTQAFLANCMMAKGMDREEAIRATAWFIEVSLALRLIPTQVLERNERNEYILKLAGQDVSRTTIALRVGLVRSKVFEALKQQQQARRAALRTAV